MRPFRPGDTRDLLGGRNLGQVCLADDKPLLKLRRLRGQGRVEGVEGCGGDGGMLRRRAKVGKPAEFRLHESGAKFGGVSMRDHGRAQHYPAESEKADRTQTQRTATQQTHKQRNPVQKHGFS
jgi:hypothetical protein